MLFAVLYFVTSLSVCESAGLPLPFNPCSDVFQYDSDEMNEIYGIMTFKNDHSGSYRVLLNMSLTRTTNENLGIKRFTPIADVRDGADLVYHVTFPSSNRIPKVTGITFNQHTYCSMMEPIGKGMFLTAFDYFSLPIMEQEELVTTQRPRTTPTISYELNVPITKHFQQPSFVSFTLPHTPIKTTVTSPVMKNATTQLPTTATTPRIVTKIQNITKTQPTTESIQILKSRYLEEIECGVGEDTQALVVNGALTSEGQYPWLVAMFHLQETGEYKFKCAGNLVSNRHVITAAHCVKKANDETLAKENIILVLGKHNIKSWAVRSEIRDVKEIFVHPDYTKPSDGDISVLIMYKEVKFSDKIKPVCLWSETTETIVGNEGTVIGWGRDELYTDYVTEPKELSMPVVSQEDCLRSDARFLKLTSARTFCAGTRNGKGACTGDSGGGFIMKRKGRWTLRGIVSSALVDTKTRSCDVNNYMVFADVVKYKLWIERIMAR